MELELISKKENGSSHYERAKKIVHYNFLGLVNIPLTKEIFNETMEFAKNNQIIGSFTDITTLKGTFTALNDYFATDYMPFMLKQGLKCSAIVLPPDIFTQFAANDLAKRSGKYEANVFELRNFKDLKEAYAWVESKIK